MGTVEIMILLERSRRAQIAERVAQWERENGMRLVPMERDPMKSAFAQVVDEGLEEYLCPLTHKRSQWMAIPMAGGGVYADDHH